MPSKSLAQHRLMEAAAHAKGGYDGVPQSVGQEFAAADAARGSPKSRDEHMARKAKHGSQREVAGDFGTSQSTVSRRTMKRGFSTGSKA